jgi:hypothetical protein
VNIRRRNWTIAEIRACFAERCAPTNTRNASVLPVLVFAVANARPAITARAASIASRSSSLPFEMTFLPIRTCYFHHHQPGSQHVPREAGAIRTCAFHTDTLQPTVAVHPRHHPPKTRRCHREACDAEHTTNTVDDSSDMLIQMRVDPTDDNTR